MSGLRYIELKTGYHDDGPAWIARVKTSKSGRTIYFNGRALKRGAAGSGGNHFDLVTLESFWVSGVKRDGTDRLVHGSDKVLVEAAAVQDYLALTGATHLDESRFEITHEIRETNPQDFVSIENKRGTLFGWLYLVGAAVVTLTIVVRGMLRFAREPNRRILITAVTALALAMWAAATYRVSHYVFEVLWMVAHTRPAPDGLFSEGGSAYAVIGGYLLLGAALVFLIGSRRITRSGMQ